MGLLALPVDVAIFMFIGALGAIHGAALHARGVRLTLNAGARQFPLLSVLGLLFIAVILTFFVSRSYPPIWWDLPVSLQYYNIPVGWSVTAGFVSFLFGAVCTLAFRQRHKARWILTVIGVAVLVLGEYAIRHSILLQPPRLGPPQITSDGVILQSSAASCAATACANIARYYGVPATERQMVHLLGTTADGTTAAQVIYGMRRLGFRCRKCRVPDRDVTQVRAPAVLFVTAGNDPFGHAVAYMGTHAGVVEIWNPSFGTQFLTPYQVKKIWHGYAVEIQPPKSAAAPRGFTP